MQHQLTLLEQAEWDVLIVLDACRADYFHRICRETGHQVLTRQTVRSTANNTAGWIKNAGRLLAERCTLYATANPVVMRSLDRYGVPDVKFFDLSAHLWGKFTPERVPSVHPHMVSAALLEAVQPFVGHYLQPHSPYIGDPPLAMARWGRAKEGLYAACHALRRPEKAVAAGDVTWDHVRAAYAGNLELVWDAVRFLLDNQPEGTRVVVTADHGEVLGEHGGKFGHEGNWHFDEQHFVPWLELVCVGSGGRSEDDRTREKLEALGYA